MLAHSFEAVTFGQWLGCVLLSCTLYATVISGPESSLNFIVVEIAYKVETLICCDARKYFALQGLSFISTSLFEFQASKIFWKVEKCINAKF